MIAKQEDFEPGHGESTWTQHEDLTDDCFLCGKKLTVPFVFWRGLSSICLHPECAGRLGSSLVRDFFEAELTTKEQADQTLRDWKRRYITD
jgi:hypothetical protein